MHTLDLQLSAEGSDQVAAVSENGHGLGWGKVMNLLLSEPSLGGQSYLDLLSLLSCWLNLDTQIKPKHCRD